MTLFHYQGNNAQGATSGVIEARNRLEAQRKLAQIGIAVQGVKRYRGFQEKHFWVFIESLEVLLSDDIELSKGLEILKSQPQKQLALIAEGMLQQLQAGSTFVVALGYLFPNLPKRYLSILQAGDNSTGLGYACQQLILNHTDKQQRQRELSSALAYPALVMIIALLVIVVLLDVILPDFSRLLAQNDHPPAVTRWLIGWANEGLNSVVALVWSAVFVGLLVWSARQSKGSEIFIAKVSAQFSWLRMLAKVQFLETLSLALNMNIGLNDAIKLSSKSIENAYLSKLTSQVPERLLDGANLAMAFKASGLFSTVELAQIQMAQESGSLQKTIERLFDQSRSRQTHMLKMLVKFVGPVTILLLGGIVLIVAYAVLTPMLSIQATIGY